MTANRCGRERGTSANRCGKAFRAVWILLLLGMLLGAGACISIAGTNAEAEPGDRTGPPETHRLVSVSVPGDAAWLFSIKPFARMKSASLVTLTKEGRFFSLEVKGGRLRAKPLPALATLSPGVPPATLDEGIIAGGTRDGSFRVIDFFRETVSSAAAGEALSPLSRLAALTKLAVATVGRDGSLMIFQKFGANGRRPSASRPKRPTPCRMRSSRRRTWTETARGSSSFRPRRRGAMRTGY